MSQTPDFAVLPACRAVGLTACLQRLQSDAYRHWLPIAGKDGTPVLLTLLLPVGGFFVNTRGLAVNLEWLCVAVAVVAPPAFGAGARTSPIVLTPDEATVCAVNQDGGSISVWDWPRDEEVREIAVGDEPRTLAVSPDGRRVYVANQCSQTLSVVDLPAGKAIDTIELGGQPYGVLLSGDGGTAFISQYAGAYIEGKYHPGAIAVVDLKSAKVVRRIPVKARPQAMALSSNGKSLYVAHYLQIDGKGIVTEIDPESRCVRREITLGEDDDVVGGRGGVANALAGIALHPDGRRALVACMHANARRGLELSGRLLSHKTTVQAAVRVLDLEAGRELYDARIVSSFDGQAVAVPIAVAFIGSGEHFIDLYFASNDLKIIRYNEKGYVAERALASLPAGPTGVAVSRDGKTAFVNSRWDRSISRLSIEDVRNVRIVKTVRKTAEPWLAERIRGAVLFHNTRDAKMTANRWISCGVCHLEGGEVGDGLMWDLTTVPESPKVSNTMDLVLTPGTSPPFFHRGATDVGAALEDFVRFFHGGSGFLGPEFSGGMGGGFRGFGPRMGRGDGSRRLIVDVSKEWAAIAAYIGGLRPRPNPHMDGDLPRDEIRESARRGRAIFFDTEVGCGGCHSGPRLTVSGSTKKARTYDVGTGKKMDVPSLLHLWDTAPFLHDGRAATLREVLTTHNADDRHGRTSHLSEQELVELESFLLAPFFESGKDAAAEDTKAPDGPGHSSEEIE